MRGDPNHRNIIQHLYHNFQGEGHLLENKTGDKLPEAWRKNGGTKHTCGGFLKVMDSALLILKKVLWGGIGKECKSVSS